MNAWQEYKARLGSTRPWNLVGNAPRVDEAQASSRLGICVACDELIQVTKQCKQCGCFMAGKVKLANATCPLGKW